MTFRGFIEGNFFDEKSTEGEDEKKKIKFLEDEISNFLTSETNKINKILFISKSAYFTSLFLSLNILKPFLKNKLDAYIKKTKYNNKKIKFLANSLCNYIQVIIPHLMLMTDSHPAHSLLESFILYGMLDTLLENKKLTNIFINNLNLFFLWKLSNQDKFIQMRQLFRLTLLKTFFREEDIDEIDKYQMKEFFY